MYLAGVKVRSDDIIVNFFARELAVGHAFTYSKLYIFMTICSLGFLHEIAGHLRDNLQTSHYRLGKSFDIDSFYYSPSFSSNDITMTTRVSLAI